MLGIFREELYSPNRVSDDAAVLRLTAKALRRQGYPVKLIAPTELTQETEPCTTFSMSEGSLCLRILERWESMGYAVINSPRAVLNTHRHRMLSLLGKTTIPFPKTMLLSTSKNVNGHFDLSKGVWVKRGDVHATHPDDVQLHFDRASLEENLRALRARWVKHAVLQEHINGDLIKFYGVLPQKWFKHFYHKPEKVNGYPFSPEKLCKTAEMVAARLGLKVYGGDFVVNEHGYYLIDINNWPSFAICREEAAEQIASYLVRRSQRWESSQDLQWRSA